MYFASRTEAGQKLAEELSKYRYENSAVISLSDGGVVIGAQIAAQLHCPLMFLLMKDITLPGEHSALGVVDQNGGFTYNDMFSAGELENLLGEYHNFVEQEKLDQWRSMNRILGDDGIVDTNILQDRNIILVSDGLMSGTSLLAAVNFLKPVRTQQIIVATPYASVQAVERMHLAADELHVLSVIDDTFGLDHYYEKDDVPGQEDIIRVLNEAILKWK